MAGSSAGLGPDGPFASPCEGAPGAGSPAASWAGTAVDGDNNAGHTAQLPAGRYVIRGLPREDTAHRPGLPIHDRDDAATAGPRSELDLLGACIPQTHVRDIRCQRRPRTVADLAGPAFIDCTCLSVLARHCKGIRGRGGAFAHAGPPGTVLRILAVTGLPSWFEVHDTVQETVTGAGTRRSADFLATPVGPRPYGVPSEESARSRVIPEVFVSHESAVGAGRGPRHGGGAVPAPAWLS
jgi:anti-anti-sigma factor